MAYAALLALGALDAAGYSVIAPVVPSIAEETGAGPGILGALVATFAVGMAGGFVLGGQGVHRRRASFVLGASVAVMTLGCLGFVLGDGRLAVYFLARFVMGIGSGGLWIGITFATLERFPGQEYRRLTGVLAAYSVGGVAGAGLGVIGGIRGPFLLYLGLALAAGVWVRLLGEPCERAAFRSDRAALRSPVFLLACAGILLVALALGTLEGPLPLHFSSLLSQAEISGLYVVIGLVVGTSAALAGNLPPRPALAAASALIVGGIALAGAGDSVPVWLAAVTVAGLGFGMGESGALGICSRRSVRSASCSRWWSGRRSGPLATSPGPPREAEWPRRSASARSASSRSPHLCSSLWASPVRRGAPARSPRAMSRGLTPGRVPSGVSACGNRDSESDQAWARYP